MTTATARRYVVRVSLDEEQAENEMVLGTVEFVKAAGYGVVQEDTFAPLLFDLLPPAGISDEGSHEWADQLAVKLRAQGYDAIIAPPWDEA